MINKERRRAPFLALLDKGPFIPKQITHKTQKVICSNDPIDFALGRLYAIL